MGLKQYEADQFIRTSGTSSQYLMADGSISTGPSGGVDVGTGTANKVAKFSDSDTITDSTITDDGTDVSITGKLGIQTAAPDSLIHIEHEDNNYDVSRGIHIDYTKDHTGTGWSAGVFGVRSTITHEGTGKTTDVTAGRFQALHEGTGIAYFLYGSSSRGTHNGSGNTGVIWGAFNQGAVSGTGTGTHPFLIGTNNAADLNNANASVGKMSGITAYAKTTAGDITTRVVGAEIGLDCNQGSTTTVDAAVLHLEADVGSLTVSGNARTINSVSTLPSVFAGSIQSPTFNIGSEDSYLFDDSGVIKLYGDQGVVVESGDGVSISISEQIDVTGGIVSDSSIQATSFIKTGGTSSQFLKADGSVDSNTYAVGTIPTDFVSAASGGTFNGNIGINEASPQEELHVTGRAIISDRLAVGGNFTPQKSMHMKNAAPVFRMEDSDTAGYAEFLKSSSNFTFRVDPTGVESASELRFQVDGNELMTVREDGVGFGDITPTEMVDVNGNVKADSFIKDGGTSSQFLKADGSVDSTSYTTGAHPTDFVSAASGGSFGGGIVADSFTITGLSSGNSFLKANGSLDGTVYNSGTGTSGGIAIYNGTNTTTDDSNLQYNFLSSTLTSRNLDVSVDLNVGGDVDVTGSIVCDSIQADGWIYVPQTFQSNFVHSSGNGYMNLPFNSLSDASSGGEQHFIVTPYQGYVHSVAFKNTATGNTMTGTNMNFRVLVNGVTSHTSGAQTFTAAARTYKGWVLNSTDATFNSGDDLRFQFQCTSGFWQDTCAVVVLKCII